MTLSNLPFVILTVSLFDNDQPISDHIGEKCKNLHFFKLLHEPRLFHLSCVDSLKFQLVWKLISLHPCFENQLDALFILSLFRHSNSTCFGHICSPSSGGILYIYNNWYVLCFLFDSLLSELSWNSIPTRTTDSQLKSSTRTKCCIYTV
jgi:hypothetical protein